MFVDTDLLRMGADFSRSAGEIVHRGGDRLASAHISNGAFGDFDAAQRFQSALRRAHETHSSAMREHHAKLSDLSDKAIAGATAFLAQDRTSASQLRSASQPIP